MSNLIQRLRLTCRGGDGCDCTQHEAADRIEAQAAEIARLREANGILEDALQEVGDDYPGSSCQEWCRQQVKVARAALEVHHGAK